MNLEITQRHWEFFKEMYPFMDGGLSFTHYTSCPECEFENFAEKYGTEIMDGVHLQGYAYGMNSRKLKAILDICEKHNVFFLMDPDIRADKLVTSRFGFSFVPSEGVKNG